jgi:oligopeptide transport system substrate-binding protein
VKWSDGVPLKAQDFVYSWKRLLAPTTGASYAYFLFDVDGAEAYTKGKSKDFGTVGIKAIDDSTFQVKLAHPVPYWIYIPTFWVTFPLRQDIVEKHGTSWDSPGKMVSLGAFSLVSHDHDSKIVLKANPHYWGQRGNIEQVVGLIVKDDSSALNLYESGTLDFLTDISTLDLKRLAGRPDLKSFPYFKTGYLGMVTDKYPLSNPKVRRAIAMAIDKAKLGEILHGAQQPATSFVPPRMMAHSDRVGLPFDPAKAKAELKSSGLDLGRTWTLELVLPNWDKSLLQAQYIQSELKKNLGLNVVLQPFDNKTFRSQVDLKVFPLFQLTWSADFPDPDNYMTVFTTGAGNNRTKWGNARYDELVRAARTMRESKAREKAYLESQRILLEDEAVIVPLYYEPNMALVRSRVKGLELNPLNYLLLRKVNLE